MSFSSLLLQCLRGFVRRILDLVNVSALLERFGSFRRHIVLVVLGHDLIGVENSVRADPTLCDTAAAFFEKVRLDPLVDNRNASGRVGDREFDCQTIALSLETALLD